MKTSRIKAVTVSSKMKSDRPTSFNIHKGVTYNKLGIHWSQDCLTMGCCTYRSPTTILIHSFNFLCECKIAEIALPTILSALEHMDLSTRDGNDQCTKIQVYGLVDDINQSIIWRFEITHEKQDATIWLSLMTAYGFQNVCTGTYALIC